jgi:uncharacterized damage-inducible protein DinB
MNLEMTADQLEQLHAGPAWHGPSLREALEGVDAALAARRPAEEAHNIWELVGHITVWEEVCARWLSGEAVEELAPGENFPAAGGGEAAWRALRDRSDRASRSLDEAIRRFPPSRLDEIVPARDYTFATLIRNVPFHGVYHAGQIMILKKVLNGSRTM